MTNPDPITEPQRLWDERIAPHVVITDEGCWRWTGATVKGYSQVRAANKQVYLHRFSWTLHRGPIPAGLTIDHLCHKRPCPGGDTCPHRACLNPDHLEPVTNAENARRRPNAPGTLVRRLVVGKLCTRGRHFIASEDDLYVSQARARKSVTRECKHCKSEYGFARKAARAAA